MGPMKDWLKWFAGYHIRYRLLIDSYYHTRLLGWRKIGNFKTEEEARKRMAKLAKEVTFGRMKLCHPDGTVEIYQI